jgi:NhaC family Na+:H+ antiporter
MLSGVVPTLIDYGLGAINDRLFLFITCGVCAFVSVVTGSSWTTIATIGVAFMGIGTTMGYSEGWIAGAIISGAYFGDKVSPLSDTTVIASSTCGVDLFEHIRYLMITSGPAMAIALIVFMIYGFAIGGEAESHATEMLSHLHASFNITPWVLIIPIITGILIAARINTLITLALSSVLGLAGIFLFQPQILHILEGSSTAGIVAHLQTVGSILFRETSIPTGYDLLDDLVCTGGIEGMIPTITLVLSAMIFGGALIGTGMIATITRSFTHHLKQNRSIVGATVGTGLLLNSCTADQYLSIIIGGNVYNSLYRRYGLPKKLLSRSLEDSISVTSVLIPWNSCGVTQSTVLGVSTLTYLPYCIFNYMSPIMSLIVVSIGYRIYRITAHLSINTSA